MIRPDFREFRGSGLELMHSAKGTTWKNHKYVRKEGNRYIYPTTEEGKTSGSSKKETKEEREKREKEILQRYDEDEIQKHNEELIQAWMDAKTPYDKAEAQANIDYFSKQQERASSVGGKVERALNNVKDFVVGKEGKIISSDEKKKQDAAKKKKSEAKKKKSVVTKIKKKIVGEPGKMTTKKK